MPASIEVPDASFFLPDPLKRELFRRRVHASATSGKPVLHFTHAHCLDGATCDALVRLARGRADVETAFLDPHECVPALEVLTRLPDGTGTRELVVSDLSFQKGEGAHVLKLLQSLRERGWRVAWRDHHHKQWDGAPVDAMAAAVELRLDTTGTECGATLVAKDLLPGNDFAMELAHVVRDHDLWLREDARSIVLQQACQHVGSEQFVDHVLHSKRVTDAMIEAWSREEAARRDTLVHRAVADAWFKIGRDAVVGVAYGSVPTNEVLHTLYEEKGAHLAILLKPEGTFSLRSRKDVPVCHRIAQDFGGGGHPNASGGRMTLPPWQLPIYWATRGQTGAEALVARAVDEVDAFLAESKT